jgi:superfamily II DNA or RNA helicase
MIATMTTCCHCEFPTESPVYANDGAAWCSHCWPLAPDTEPVMSDIPTASGLRDYQLQAHDAVYESLVKSGDKSSLVVMPTGTGKTVLFGHVAGNWPSGRVLIMAHRDELIRQAADKVGKIIGETCDIEMGDDFADQCNLYSRSHVVVTSVQTMSRERRMSRFNPDDFGLLVIDEAHHATASTYRKVIDYFRQNESLRVLGVTATPDRTDEEALGKVFDSVAYEYEITKAIDDGWLVPIEQRFVYVEGLDFSDVRTTAGDLNAGDLAKVMEDEKALHKVVNPVIELAGDQPCLVFAASVAHAERMAEIANRHKPGQAEFVHGGTDKELRRDMLRRFNRREFQFLFNCMIATEGFDEPQIGVVAVARPTKSRALYSQMIGRGTRPLTGCVDGLPGAEARKQSIATSGKPSVLVLDFVGNSGRHKLVSTADILGGNMDDAVVERARSSASKKSANGQSADMTAELIAAREAIEEENRKRRAAILAKASYGTKCIDPFVLYDVTPTREPGWFKGKRPTDKMAAVLEKRGIATRNLSLWQAKQLMPKVINKPTLKQAGLLLKFGYSTDCTSQDASKIIDKLAANGWRRPKD